MWHYRFLSLTKFTCLSRIDTHFHSIQIYICSVHWHTRRVCHTFHIHRLQKTWESGLSESPAVPREVLPSPITHKIKFNSEWRSRASVHDLCKWHTVTTIETNLRFVAAKCNRTLTFTVRATVLNNACAVVSSSVFGAGTPIHARVRVASWVKRYPSTSSRNTTNTST